ncbi:hypothetical protein HUG17_9118 [Dermatophagoides farinae]|uniref:Uncharacterized protein n=1 Tax=Dermatophagoides farinae TaxID=6954 RepID=A0A9D4NTL3_DERFA|nr:hypothetical protein HUG17_9118 [Dermatophagoides farinae]
MAKTKMAILSIEKYRNIQISDIFHCGFEYWKNYTLRCEYSLYEYQYRMISKRFEFFRHNIWISFNAWAGILFLLAMIWEPFNEIIIGNKHFERIVDGKKTDLLLIYGAISYSIFELMWSHLFKNFLHYRSSMDDYLIKNIDYDEKQLLPELHSSPSIDVKITKSLKQKSTNPHYYRGHQRFNLNEKINKIFWNRFQIEYVNLYAETAQLNRTVSLILFYMETMSKFAIIFSCVFISQQLKMNWMSFSSVMAIMSLFFLILCLNCIITTIPSIDKNCSKFIFYDLARSQWHRFRMVNQSMTVSLVWRHWIKSNLFVQTMTENRFGFTCGQLFFITKFKYFEMLFLNLPLIMLFYKKICLSGSI